MVVVTAQSEPKPKSMPRLRDALAFGGPAPERTNGRLAMVGFVSALAVEASSTRGGDCGGLLAQAASGAGQAWFGYAVAGAEARSGGFMTADAELWNGCLAMLGLVALSVTEYLTGAPFIKT